MQNKSIYCCIVYAFFADGGESVAQADRIFLILRGTRYTDHAVYQEHRAPCDTCRRAASDRVPVVLLIAKGGAHAVGRFLKRVHKQKKKLNISASFLNS